MAANLRKTITLICFAISFFMSSSVSVAQTLTFLGGVSLPSGTYGSNEVTSHNPGLAKTGYRVSVIYDQNNRNKIINPFIQYAYNNNPIGEDRFYRYINTSGRFVGFSPYNAWSQNMIIVGPRFTYFSDKFDLNVKAGIGMIWLNSYGYTIFDTLVKDYIKYNILHVNTLVYSIGGGANIYINSGVTFCFGYEFIYARPNYGIEKFTYSKGAIFNSADIIKNEIPLAAGTFYVGLRFFMKRSSERNKKIFN